MDAWIPESLRLPGGALDMVLDTDAFNEVDDQFALCYALLSPERVNVRAVYAAPFHNERSGGAGDGMEKSYAEVLRLLGHFDRPAGGFVYRGSERFWQGEDDCVDSPAARDLIARAMARPAGAAPLYVAAIGAITNVASALRMEPRIAERIRLVWLAGAQPFSPEAGEFNLSGDLAASLYIFNESRVPMTLVPCRGVTSHLLASVPELEKWLGGKNPLCDALVDLFAHACDVDPLGWAKELWDVGAVACLIRPESVSLAAEPRPVLTPDERWVRDPRRPPILVAERLDRNAIFRDMFRKLAAHDR